MKAVRTAVAIVGTVASVVQFIPGPWQAPAAIIAAAAAVASTALAIIDKTKPSQTGSPTTFDARADGPIPYVMGRTANAGKLVYWKDHKNTRNNTNDRQTFVTVLSGAGPIEGFERFDVDQSTVTFDGSYNANGFYHGYMWMKTQLGLSPSPQLNYISGEGTPAPGWTAQHLLSGYAAAMWTLVFDSKKGKYYQNGTPPALWVMRGVRVYDPRQDSTFPGGSGPCRAGVESTYVYAGVGGGMPAGENPFLHALTWLIGRFQNNQRILGIGIPLVGADTAAFAEGANVCDANNWRIGGVVYSTDNKWNTLVNILQAGGGTPLALGAKVSCTVNSPKVALDTIRVGDLSGGVTVAATQSRRDRINTIIPRCRLEEQFWEQVPLAPVSVASYFPMDGGQRSKEVLYTFVQQTAQAAQLARYDIENAREFGPISLPLRPRWMGYKPGDCVNVVLPEVGLNGQKVMLTQRMMDPGTGLPVMTAQSETDAKHPFALGQTTIAPPTPTVASRVAVPKPGDTAWAITAASIPAAGTNQPAIVIEGALDDTNADAIVFEYRVYAAGAGAEDNWIAAGIEPPTTLRKVISGIASGASIQVGVSNREFGRVGERLVLGPVTAGSLTVSDNTSTSIATSFPIGLTITAAASGAITISNHVRRYTDGHADVNVTGATVASGAAANTMRAIAYDDLTRVGGAVTYNLYPDDIDARVSPAYPGRHYVGYAYIPASGSPPASGGGSTPPGGTCVTADSLILMADDQGRGPGIWKPASEVRVGDRVWTQHEHTRASGCHVVLRSDFHMSPVFTAAGYPDASPRHRFEDLAGVEDWVRMEDLGVFSRQDLVWSASIAEAATYVARHPDQTTGVLSHNVKIRPNSSE